MINKNIERSKETSLEKLEEHLKKIEDKTKLNRKKIFIILISSFILIWLGILDIQISYFLTIYYPSIWSLKVIGSTDSERIVLWVTYWLTFAAFMLLDLFSPILIKLIPFYFIIRTVILLWMALPNFKGALTVYNVLIVELLKFLRTLKGFRLIDSNSLKSEVEQAVKERLEKEEIIFENFKDKSPLEINLLNNSSPKNSTMNVTNVLTPTNSAQEKKNN